jgi:hypothetical protein
MRAIRFTAFGDPSVLELADLGARPDSHRDGQLLQGSRLRLPLRG